jgi:tetratricopeptide (TPR) repeat protein
MVLSMICAGPASLGQDGLRRLRVGDGMPEFSLTDPHGAAFKYEHGQTRVLGVVVLQAGQTHLDRLLTDLEGLAETLRAEGATFDCIGVMSGPGASDYLRSRDAEAREAFPILADPNFAFWGKLGVIAAPSAIVAGADHKVQWVKAGYGYDFVPGFHTQLAKALGLGAGADATVRVETLENTSSRARRDRHIQLARTLAKKGRWELAIQELEKLRQLDPNAVDVALELGAVLCRAGRNEAALTLASGIKAEASADKARAMLISAWAKRQMGDASAAEPLLVKALELVPKSPRILYELGQVHQAKGEDGKALDCYRTALAELLGDTDGTGPSQK